MAHGNIYPAERIDAALGNYFRAGNLGALRELALLWVADRVDEALRDYRERHGIDRPWETRERVVVALTGSRRRRAPRPARRAHGRSAPKGDLFAVHVVRRTASRRRRRRCSTGSASSSRSSAARYREVVGADIGEALVDGGPHAERDPDRARRDAAGRASRELTRGSVINRVIRDSGVGSTCT